MLLQCSAVSAEDQPLILYGGMGWMTKDDRRGGKRVKTADKTSNIQSDPFRSGIGTGGLASDLEDKKE